METNHDTEPTTKRLELLKQNLDALRDQLVSGAMTEDRAVALHDTVQAIAKAEAIFALEYQVAMHQYRDVEDLTEDESRVKIAEYTRDSLLMSGADDTWSGRSNDLKRAVFDAKRKWVTEVLG